MRLPLECDRASNGSAVGFGKMRWRLIPASLSRSGSYLLVHLVDQLPVGTGSAQDGTNDCDEVNEWPWSNYRRADGADSLRVAELSERFIPGMRRSIVCPTPSKARRLMIGSSTEPVTSTVQSVYR